MMHVMKIKRHSRAVRLSKNQTQYGAFDEPCTLAQWQWLFTQKKFGAKLNTELNLS